MARVKKGAVIKKTVEGDIEYHNVKEAAKSIRGAKAEVIEKALRGTMPTAYGCRWRYK